MASLNEEVMLLVLKEICGLFSQRRDHNSDHLINPRLGWETSRYQVLIGVGRAFKCCVV